MDKVLEASFTRLGYHPKDCKEMKKSMMQDIPDNRENGYLRPIYRINGHKTKQPHIKCRNYFACGCKGNHDPDNQFCDYGNVKLLLEELPEALRTRLAGAA